MQGVYPLKHPSFAGEHRQYLVRATYLEIYQEEVRDLLSKNPNQRLEVKESAEKGVYVKGLVQFVVKSVAEINSVLQVCLACHLNALLCMSANVCVNECMRSLTCLLVAGHASVPTTSVLCYNALPCCWLEPTECVNPLHQEEA